MYWRWIVNIHTIAGMRWRHMTCQRWWTLYWLPPTTPSCTTSVTHKARSSCSPTWLTTHSLLKRWDYLWCILKQRYGCLHQIVSTLAEVHFIFGKGNTLVQRYTNVISAKVHKVYLCQEKVYPCKDTKAGITSINVTNKMEDIVCCIVLMKFV